jgi:hypothetical protein
MEDHRKAVLERVARGELSPSDAAALLEQMEAPQAQARQTEGAPPPGGAGFERATRVRVIATMGRTDIIGDPGVQEAIADGPHVARRDGDTLVIESDTELEGPFSGFYFSWRGRPTPRRRYGWNAGDHRPLLVRVNPNLPIDVEGQAGSINIRNVHAPIRADVQAGGLRIEDFSGPIDLTGNAGSVRAEGVIDRGASQIRCHAGSVRLHLRQGSSVRVSAHATLGSVRFNHDRSPGPWVVGGGDGQLTIEATMGSVRVTSDQ